ncbi:MAG TPA: hypothetical protein VN896_08415 [Methylomirabilota bacterium]|nr:hypothetical protein [Methylomirabilota bacterium]
MPKFLIEVPHEADTLECTRVVHVFLSTGSHFLTNAEWGCKSGVHSAWMLVDMDDKAQALAIVPPAFRAHARIVGLTRFTLTEIEPALRKLEERARRG